MNGAVRIRPRPRVKTSRRAQFFTQEKSTHMPSLKSLRIVVGGLVVIGLSADSARASDTVAVATNVNSVTQVTTGGTAPTLTLATVNAGTNRFTDATDFT